MNKRIISILVAILLSATCHCQENIAGNDTVSPYKFSLNITAGYGVLYATATGNLEFMVWEIPTSFISSMWVRAGLGPWIAWEENGINYLTTLMVLTGRKKHHIEFGAGIMVMHNSDDDYNTILPAGNIGYRL